MTTYYVRKDGDDTTGDGSSALPWLTISKAITTVAEGSIVNIGDGLYEEDTAAAGYFNINRAGLADYITLQAELGTAASVQIQGATHATENSMIRNGYWRFNDIQFTQRIVTNARAFLFRANSTITDPVEFNRCTFTITADGVTSSNALLSSPAATFTHDGVTFNDCAFNVLGYDSGTHYGCYLLGGGGVISNWTFNNCTANGNAALYINGATGITINGGVYTSYLGAGIRVGIDGAAGGQVTTVTINNATCQTPAGYFGHACLIGNGATNCVVNGLIVPVCKDYALVIKENTGTVVTHCSLKSGASGALYCKAAVSPVITYNKLIAAQGSAFIVGWNSVGGNKCQNVTFTHNYIRAVAAGYALNWGKDDEDLGGGICDYNVYEYTGSADLGTVRAVSDITTMPALQGAWVGYDVPTNDSHSRIPNNNSFLLRRYKKRKS